MKTYRLEQRAKQWKTIAIAANCDELIAQWEAIEIKNGKRIVRSDGKVVCQTLPEAY